MSQDLEVVRDALRGINEELSEYTRSTERLDERVKAHEARIDDVETALNGEGAGKPGLETRVTLLERTDEERKRAERKTAKAMQGGESALERVETARAGVAMARWKAIATWGAIAGGLGAGVKALVEYVTK